MIFVSEKVLDVFSKIHWEKQLNNVIVNDTIFFNEMVQIRQL